MTETENAALIHADQARTAANAGEYLRAADHFAEAAASKGLPTALQWKYRNEQALMLAEQGREFKNNAALEQSIKLYEKTVLGLAPREARPDDWATTQHNFGNALGLLGQRHRAPHLLERAVMVFENALSVRSREQSPLEWATTQDNYGI